MKWQFLCAADLQPIEEGKQGIVTLGTTDPVSVYVHDQTGCRKAARRYPSDLESYAARFDSDGKPI